jgi:hypothetical protein
MRKLLEHSIVGWISPQLLLARRSPEHPEPQFSQEEVFTRIGRNNPSHGDPRRMINRFLSILSLSLSARMHN